MNYTGYLETDDPFFCVTLVADTFWVVLLTLPLRLTKLQL